MRAKTKDTAIFQEEILLKGTDSERDLHLWRSTEENQEESF